MLLISSQSFCLYFCFIFNCVKVFLQPLEYSLWEQVNMQKNIQKHKKKSHQETVSSLTTPHGDQSRVSSQVHKQMQLQSSCHAITLLGCPLISYMPMHKHFSPSLITHQCSQQLLLAACSHGPGHPPEMQKSR